ncbi:protein of unknown function [Streptococcus thermophilus]|uniref:Uncharacterized protein n=1 Tax=Streptococcus thermophilus TaxID=1308 RepID=A0A8D6U1J6_STRTR|nr:protein of unknown function [Streptococcus thermophilus]
MDKSYQQLAVQMTSAISAWVCGVDLIIPDENLNASKEEPNCSCMYIAEFQSSNVHTHLLPRMKRTSIDTKNPSKTLPRNLKKFLSHL